MYPGLLKTYATKIVVSSALALLLVAACRLCKDRTQANMYTQLCAVKLPREVALVPAMLLGIQGLQKQPQVHGGDTCI